MQRVKSKIAKDIGIWNNILSFMTMSAIFINILILIYTVNESKI